jgi:hypothetical protein
MNVQELEELEFAPQSEAENCLREAMPAAIENRGPIVIEGFGHIEVTVKIPVFCKSTDAFAGMMEVRKIRFRSQALADAWMEKNMEAAYSREEEVTVKNIVRQRVHARIQKVYKIIYHENLPHNWEEILKNFRPTGIAAYATDREMGSSRISGLCSAIETAHTAFLEKCREEDNDVPF